MAVEPTPDTPLRGLALPAIRTQGGYFASKGPHDVAWGDLLLALFTPIGARFMSRQFGSSLHSLLFEPDPEQNPQLVDFIVRDTAERETPQIVIDNVDVLLEGRAFTVQIAFHLLSDQTTETRLVQVRRDGTIKTLAGRRAS